MKKLLYIAPHLSTGGMPQYLYKIIEHFSKKYEVHLIEWTDVTGGVLVVSRNKILSVLHSDNFYSLGEDKNSIKDIISKISPDIIHFQEDPHSFIDSTILDWIYSDNRKYNIVVTTHGSFTEPSKLPYLADKFVLASDWSKDVFDKHFKGSIPTEVWEYELDEVQYDKAESKKEIGFDSEYYHVLHVGLFTSGKNQKHIIEVAKRCLPYKIKFHFVGNQAVNFEQYWKPLMEDFPSNCIWHGERSDVHKFYKAADLFIFPSLYELNPISIKEALSYKLPIFITKLPTYKTKYDGIATYIDDDVSKTTKLLLNHFNIDSSDDKIMLFHILTDIDIDREIRSMQDLTKLEDYGIKYQPIISKRYTELPPKESCAFPDIISMESGGTLTPGHYGCYLGHRSAFETAFDTDVDFAIISECDTILDIPHSEFVEKIKFAIDKLKTDDISIFSMCYHHDHCIIEKTDDYWVSDSMTGAHMYIIPKRMFGKVFEIYKNEKWNVADLFLATHLGKEKIAYFKTPYTKQAGGFSLLENIISDDRY